MLSKLPLVRFCQPNDPSEVRYWYDLLGAINVTFAVCSANGRVLAAIDLDTDRGNSRRILQIKQSVLGACRVRYLRCPVDNLPTAAELQLLVPSSSGPARGPQPASSPPRSLAEAPRLAREHGRPSRRAAAHALWQDSRVPGFVLRARQPRWTASATASSAALTRARPLAAAVAGARNSPAPTRLGASRPSDDRRRGGRRQRSFVARLAARAFAQLRRRQPAPARSDRAHDRADADRRAGRPTPT